AEMVSATRSLPADPANVLVTRGSQMAWTLLARALFGPGDTVAVETLGYRPAWKALQHTGARLAPVPVDAAGLPVDAADDLARTAGPCTSRRTASTRPRSPWRRTGACGYLSSPPATGSPLSRTTTITSSITRAGLSSHWPAWTTRAP